MTRVIKQEIQENYMLYTDTHSKPFYPWAKPGSLTWFYIIHLFLSGRPGVRIPVARPASYSTSTGVLSRWKAAGA